MAKIKMSAFKSTGDRAPNKPMFEPDTTMKRTTKVSKRSKKKVDEVPSEDDEDDSYMVSDSPITELESSKDSIEVPLTIQTRSGQQPTEKVEDVSCSMHSCVLKLNGI